MELARAVAKTRFFSGMPPPLEVGTTIQNPTAVRGGRTRVHAVMLCRVERARLDCLLYSEFTVLFCRLCVDSVRH